MEGKMTIDRLALNGALARLTEAWDENAAMLVVEFGSKLPKEGLISCETVKCHRDEGSITGYTQEQGNVTIRASQSEEIREINWGVKKERIGFFRLWKAREGALEFHHFWASNIAIESENPENRPPRYILEYDPKTLTPSSLAVRNRKDVLRWCGIWGEVAIVHEYLVSMYGKPKVFQISGYGLEIVRIHYI